MEVIIKQEIIKQISMISTLRDFQELVKPMHNFYNQFIYVPLINLYLCAMVKSMIRDWESILIFFVISIILCNFFKNNSTVKDMKELCKTVLIKSANFIIFKELIVSKMIMNLSKINDTKSKMLIILSKLWLSVNYFWIIRALNQKCKQVCSQTMNSLRWWSSQLGFVI